MAVSVAAAAATPCSSSSISSIYAEIGAKARNPSSSIYISTNPSHVNAVHLRDLFTSANLSCHRFPNLITNPHTNTVAVEPVDTNKLRTALSNSLVVVSVFSPSPFPFPFPFPPPGSDLVGFGRAISDCGLTASIHDVVVLPSFQRLGIATRILNKILRVLTSRGIYDISALCSEKERLFFEACGFGDDILASTTMIYTKGPCEKNANKDQMIVPAGRKLLLVPPPKKIFSAKITAID